MKISTGAFHANTGVHVKCGIISDTVTGSISLNEGFDIEININLNLSTLNKYKYGFIQDTTWNFPINGTYCDDTSLFGNLDPCSKFSNSSLGKNPLSTGGFGWHLKPEAVLTATEFVNANFINAKLGSNNLNKLSIDFKCSGALEPICYIFSKLIVPAILGIFENLIIDKAIKPLINNVINKYIDDLLTYPPEF